MTRKVGGALGAAALVLMCVAGATAVSDAPAAPVPQQAQVERGRYLVHDVAMCVQCHSPRNAKGEIIPTEILQGANMPARADSLPQAWAFYAPKLAGLPGGFTEQTFVRFLMTGERTNGHRPRAPMPPFRMNQEDASAIAAYLKTLR